MKNKNDILNNKFYIISTYITYFFIINFWFLVMIAPFIFYIYRFEDNITIETLLLISIIIGPALMTLFSVMGKLIRVSEISPTRDFFHFYKINFFQGLLITIILNISLGIMYVDMNYFSSNGNEIMSVIFLFLIMLMILLSAYVYPISSRYNIKIKHLFKISIILLVRRFYISLSSVSIIIITLGIFRLARISLIGLLFGASMICYIITLIQKKTIDELEEHIF